MHDTAPPVDVRSHCALRLTPARSSGEDERDARRAVGRQLRQQQLRFMAGQEASARLIGRRESFGHDRANVRSKLAATLGGLECAT
jgi:hypothetical protein